MCFPREKQSNSAAKNVPLRRAAKAALLSALPAAGLLFRKRTGLIQGSSQMVVVGLLPPFKKQLSNVIFSYVAQRPVKSNFELAGRWHQRDSIFLASS